MKIFSIIILFLVGLQMTWAGLSVGPIKLYIDKKQQRSTIVTLTSSEIPDAKIFEASAVKWTQNEKGEDILEPATDIIINPKNFVIKPDSSQVVRVGFRTQPNVDGAEDTWRLVFHEVKPVNRDVDSLDFLWNISVPLFVGKQLPVNLKITPAINSGTTVLNILNDANSHVQINKISIIDENKKEIASNNQMKYLLAKKSFQFDFGNMSIKDWHKYKLLITTDKQENPLEFKVQGG